MVVKQRSSHELSPQLGAVLTCLDVSLEAELNRYRRNRRLDGLAEEDLFADLEDPSIELAELNDAIGANTLPAVSPPPVPPNKKLLAEQQTFENIAEHRRTSRNTDALSTSRQAQTDSSALTLPPGRTSLEAFPADTAAMQLTAQNQSTQIVLSPTALSDTQTDTGSTVAQPIGEQSVAAGYLESSEKLIESLEDIPSLPDPINLNKPKRKTVSLLAGASLGFLGLIAGLGASYLMANPTVTQRIADSFQRQGPQASSTQPTTSFDPPGPDLSANEFIDLKIDNLSSLKMPQTLVAPGELPSAPAETSDLPPIEGGAVSSQLGPNALQQPAPDTSQNTPPTPTSSTNAPSNQPQVSRPIETQAVIIPVGLTYYVTIPSSTEQDLIKARESISEAFIRRFADGNRIQLAAFDNPQAAQTLIDELADKNITAQIYGPTTE